MDPNIYFLKVNKLSTKVFDRPGRQLFRFCLITLMIVFGTGRYIGCAEHEQSQRIALMDNLLHIHRPITTDSENAQRYFDQGLALYYGFNHEGAIESFAQAGLLDTLSAMAWWGQALAAGPNINNPSMDSSASQFAYEAVQHALILLPKASAIEQDLIHALAKRYILPMPDDRSQLDSAYAKSMSKVWQKYPDDADVGALYAEALMDLRPWDLWRSDGTPNPGTEKIVSVLEDIQRKYPDHPGACHFYIHTMEASATPEKAARAADILRDKIPGAGHLVHMPAHIDIRRGKYDAAIVANQKAIKADSIWVAKGGFYTFYRAHNYHFLAYAAMFDGQKKLAIQAARDMVKQIPLEMVRAYPDFIDGFMAISVHVMVRFGMWQELLKEPEPPADLLVTKAFWYYGRTVAYAASGKVAEAEKELILLKNAYEHIPESRLIGNNPAKTVLMVGIPMAEGEVAYRRGEYEKAYDFLEIAVSRDDELRYDEPWGWMMPVRHSLGALLLEQGHVNRAEHVYRADLKIHPDNGWALLGLASCLQRENKKKEAEEMRRMFDKSWARSDIRIKTSCFCASKS